MLLELRLWLDPLRSHLEFCHLIAVVTLAKLTPLFLERG